MGRREIAAGFFLAVFSAGAAAVTAVAVAGLPSPLFWTLLLGGVGGMAGSLVGLVMLYFNAPANRPLGRRDTGAADAIAYIVNRKWGGTVFEVTAAGADMSGVVETFQQAARDGELRVWGKAREGGLYERLEPETWQRHQIEWFSLLKGQPTTETLDYMGDTTKWRDLMVSRAEVQRLWKPRRRKLTFRFEG